MHKERVKYSEISSFYNHIYKALTITQIQHYLLGKKSTLLYRVCYTTAYILISGTQQPRAYAMSCSLLLDQSGNFDEENADRSSEVLMSLTL